MLPVSPIAIAYPKPSKPIVDIKSTPSLCFTQKAQKLVGLPPLVIEAIIGLASQGTLVTERIFNCMRALYAFYQPSECINTSIIEWNNIQNLFAESISNEYRIPIFWLSAQQDPPVIILNIIVPNADQGSRQLQIIQWNSNGCFKMLEGQLAAQQMLEEVRQQIKSELELPDQQIQTCIRLRSADNVYPKGQPPDMLFMLHVNCQLNIPAFIQGASRDPMIHILFWDHLMPFFTHISACIASRDPTIPTLLVARYNFCKNGIEDPMLARFEAIGMRFIGRQPSFYLQIKIEERGERAAREWAKQYLGIEECSPIRGRSLFQFIYDRTSSSQLQPTFKPYSLFSNNCAHAVLNILRIALGDQLSTTMVPGEVNAIFPSKVYAFAKKLPNARQCSPEDLNQWLMSESYAYVLDEVRFFQLQINDMEQNTHVNSILTRSLMA